MEEKKERREPELVIIEKVKTGRSTRDGNERRRVAGRNHGEVGETFTPVQEMVRVEVALQVNYSKLNEIPTNGTRYCTSESFTSAVIV